MSIGNNYTTNDQYWVGGGAFLASEIDPVTDLPTGGFVSMGSLKQATLSLGAEALEVDSSFKGLNALSKKVVKKVTAKLKFTLQSMSPENIAQFSFGKTVANAEAVVASYTAVAKLGKIILVDGLIKTLTSVKNAAGTTTYELGKNYIVSDSGIEILADQTGATAQIAEGDTLKIAYTKAKSVTVEALTKTEVNLCLVFVGNNIADEYSPKKVTFYKVTLTPAAQIALMSAEAEAEVEIEADVLSPKHITSSDVSRFYKEEYAV